MKPKRAAKPPAKPKGKKAPKKLDAEQRLARRIGLPRGARIVEPIARDLDKLSIIIEAEQGAGGATLRRHLEDVYGDVTLEPLFPGYRPGKDIPSLQNYHVATLPNLTLSRMLANPYDIGYAALKKGIVNSAEPDMHALSDPPDCKDPHAQKHNGQERWSLDQMRVPQAWDKLRDADKARGSGIAVGHIDTGITRHELLFRQIDPIRGFDVIRGSAPGADPLPEVAPWLLEFASHGTQTSSIIAADPLGDTIGRETPMSGIAPDVQLVPYRVTRSVAVLSQRYVAEGIHRAVNDGCSVLSLSIGGTALQGVWAAIRNANNANALICCAAGQCVPFVISPALFPQSISCGGCRLRTDDSGGVIDEQLWLRCAHGKLDIAGSAEKVWNCLAIDPSGPGGTFDGRVQSEGTSFAAPAIAAIGALWLKFHEDKSLKDLYRGSMTLNAVFKKVLKDSARRPSDWHRGWGPGIVDAGAVLDAPLPSPGPQLPPLQRLMQNDQPDLFALFEAIFWDQPAAAVHAVLGRMLRAANPEQLRDALHQFGGELIVLLRAAQDHFDQVRDAVAAEAQGEADRAVAAGQRLAENASQRLRSVFGR